MRPINKYVIIVSFLTMLMMSGVTSATGTANIVQQGDSIYVWGTNAYANLTDIQTTVANASAISVSGKVFTANASIKVNGTTTTLYINDTDTTELRLNSTSGAFAVLWVNGSLEGNSSKIVGWNTTTNDYEYNNVSGTESLARAHIRMGDNTNTARINLSNFELAYLGYNTAVTANGLYATKWNNGTLQNVSIHDLYSVYLTTSESNTFNFTNIYNNSGKGLQLVTSNKHSIFKNMLVYGNDWVALSDTTHGTGIWTSGASSTRNINLTFDNISVYNNSGALLTVQYANNTNVTNSTFWATNTSDKGRGLEFNGAFNSTANNNTVFDGWRCGYYATSGLNVYRNNTFFNCVEVGNQAGGMVLYGVNNESGAFLYNTLRNNTFHVLFMQGSTNSSVKNNTITVAPWSTGADIGLDATALASENNTVQDLYDIADYNISVWAKGANKANVFINFTNNSIMNFTSDGNIVGVNRYTSTESSYYLNNTGLSATVARYGYVQVFNSTLRPNSGNVTLDLYNETTKQILINYSNNSISRINITFTSLPSIMNITLVQVNESSYLYFANNNTLINSSTNIGTVYFNDTLINGSYYISNTSQASTTYIPPSPINIAATAGSTWVNTTWQAGSGNITNSYNVSVNGTWNNGTTDTFWNSSDLMATNWSNVTVYAYNSSGTGTLNTTNISLNTQVPTAPASSSATPTTWNRNDTSVWESLGALLQVLSLISVAVHMIAVLKRYITPQEGLIGAGISILIFVIVFTLTPLIGGYISSI